MTRARDYTRQCTTVPATRLGDVFASGIDQAKTTSLWLPGMDSPWEHLAPTHSLEHVVLNPPQDPVQVRVLAGLPPSVTHSSSVSAADLSSYFNCKLKEKAKTVFELSGSTYIASNLMDEEKSKLLVKGLARSSFVVDSVAPAVLYVSRSAPWRIGLAVVAVTAGAAVLYQFVACD